MSLQITTHTVKKTGVVMANPVLKVVRLSYDSLIRKTANGPREAPRAAKKGLSGQLGVYPTLALSQPAVGKTGVQPSDLIPFSIPDMTTLPTGPNLLAQIYTALKAQTAYKDATEV
jgi:hypothetical protein